MFVTSSDACVFVCEQEMVECNKPYVFYSHCLKVSGVNAVCVCACGFVLPLRAVKRKEKRVILYGNV